MDVKPDTPSAIEFLLKWSPDGPWVLNAVDPPRKQGLIAQSFEKHQLKEMTAFIDSWNGVRNLYFMVNVPRELGIGKAKKEDVGWCVALHVDIDVSKKSEDPAKDRTVILERLHAYKNAPSIIVFSGGGYQGFWLLREPVEIEGKDGIALIESYNKQLEKDLGGDHCHNVDRIMRLPGTVNVLDPKKRAAGRVPELAKVVSADWDKIYGLEDFARYEEKGKAQGATYAGTAAGKAANGAGNGTAADWIERVLHNGPDHEGPRSYGGDRSKAVWAVCCGMVRSGWSVEEIAASILDKSNKLSDHIYAQNNPEKYARRQAERAWEHAGGDFERTAKGAIAASQGNIRLALSKLEVRLSHDDFARRTLVEGPSGAGVRPLDDDSFNQVYLAVDEEFGLRAGMEFFRMVMTNEAMRNRFHPVLDYLDKLKWDGVKRLDTWVKDYMGGKDDPYTRAVGRLFLLAAVRRVRQPGCKFDELLILESKQGMDKSGALKALAVREEWFTDSISLSVDDKQIIELITGKWIVEFPELKGMKGSDIEHHKAVLSRQVDRARLSYGRFVTEVPRQCVFGSTTNFERYLRDTTGNRRFWPVGVGTIDLTALKRDVNQLWAEAATYEAKGESIRLDPTLYEAAAEEQERREVEDPWEVLIEKELTDFPTGKILNADIWNIVSVPVWQRTQYHNGRLGDAMRKLGWERKKLRIDGRVTWCYAKGDAWEQQQRIYITRDADGLQIWRGDDSAEINLNGTGGPGGGDKSTIPF